MENAINIKNLSKKFGNFYALKDINLEIKKGQIFGLLGPNGAGKSTLMKIISTLLIQNSGEVEIMGLNLKKDKKNIRNKISLVSDYTVLEDDLTPIENLKMFAEISNSKDYTKKVNQLMEDFGLNLYKNKLTKHLSSGNKQKLNIARALVKNPDILLLDEPTNAIDVDTSRFIREYIIEENLKRDTTVIISSHYIWEIEQLASEVGLLMNGSLILKDNTEEIFKKFRESLNLYEIIFEKKDFDEIITKLKSIKTILNIKPITNQKIIIETSEKDFKLNGHNIRKLSPSLEDIYSYIVKTN